MIRKMMLVCCWLMCILTSWAQKDDYKIQFNQENFVDTIPIRFVGNRILMDAEVNGETRTFLFDTGCSHGLLADHDLTSRKTGVETGLRDATEKKVNMEGVYVNDLKIGHLTAHHVKFYEIPDTSFSYLPFIAAGVAGTIGADMMNGRYLKIDTRAGVMVLTDKKKVFKEEKGPSVKITHRYACPLFSIGYANEITAEHVVFDTGDAQMLSMSNHLKRAMDEALNKSLFSDMMTNQTVGVTGAGLGGRGDVDTATVYCLDVANIGGLQLKDVELTVSSSDTSLGAELLNYCSVIFDLKSHKITFFPYEPKDGDRWSSDSQSITIKANKSKNVGLYPVDGQWLIHTVWPDSPGHAAGAECGDRLVAFDGQPVEEAKHLLYKSIFFVERGHKMTFQKKDGSTYVYEDEKK